jgi:hypothetical protein
MIKSKYLQSIGAAVNCYLVAPIKRGRRTVVLRRWLAQLLLGGLAGLWAVAASAQYTIYLEPDFLYNWQGGPYYTTIAGIWGYVQSLPPSSCPRGSTCTWTGLEPDPFWSIQDGVYYGNKFYDQICTNGTCRNGGWTDFYSQVACPKGFGAETLYNKNNVQVVVCEQTLPAGSHPSPRYCISCFGNPIYASSGEKLQVETDYPGMTGLQFTRSYLSSNGYFASVLSHSFVNDSAPGGTAVPSCYPGVWHESNTNQTGEYCFPYISGYPYVNNGVALYFLNTAEGRTIQFAGPNTAVTQAVDIEQELPVRHQFELQRRHEPDAACRLW